MPHELEPKTEEERKWRALNDADTLHRALVIKQSKDRYAAALEMLAEMKEEKDEELDAIETAIREGKREVE